MLALLASNIKKVQLAIHRRDTIYPFTSLGYVTQANGESELLCAYLLPKSNRSNSDTYALLNLGFYKQRMATAPVLLL
jgi:hypothetical protein